MRVNQLLSLVITALFAIACWAQVSDSNLVGTVTDPTGAVLGDSTLTLTNVATGVKTTTRSNDQGNYRFQNIPVGNYTLEAVKSGFTTSSTRNITLDLNKTSTVNVTMQIGAVSTTVDVTEAAAPIDTTTAQVSTQFETRESLQLPQAANGTLGVINLSLLGAGVTSSGGVGYGTGPSVGGQRPTNNNFMVEGVDNNRKDVTGTVVDISNEAVQSFTVLQNQFSPEFGHSSGGVFNTIVKSGTNQFHGSIYEYMQNRNLNAIDIAFARGVDNPENPRYDNNRLGATAGGSIIKNKLFYFGNFEYNPIGMAGTTSSDVLAPTAAGFTTLESIQGLNANALNTFKQYVGTAPTASQTISVNGVSIPVGSLPISRPSYSNQYNWLVSSDYNISDRDQLRFRYVNSRYDGLDTFATLPAFFTTLPIRNHLANLSEFHNFSPTLINELRLSFSRHQDAYIVGDQSYPGLGVFPNLTLDELGLNIGPDPNAPQSAIQNTYQLVDNLTWTKGRHTLKFGYDGRKIIAPSFFVQRSRGDYDYTTLERFLLDKTPEFAERSAGAYPFAGDLMSHYFYVNDDFRITRKLTVNLGIRGEHVGVPAGSKLQSLNAAASFPGLISFGEPRSQGLNWAPRVGFAWAPSDTFVVRSGFGISYDQLYTNLGTLALPPQFSQTNDAEPTPADPSGFLAGGGLSGAIAPTGSVADLRAATAAYVPDQKRPYSVNWNFGIQKVFGQNYTFESRYLGTRGVHLPVQTRLNRSAPVTATNSLPTFYSQPSQSQLDSLTLTLSQLQAIPGNVWASQGFLSNVTAFMPWGNSSYHGWANELTRRFSAGLTFKAAYTWSHAIDDSTAAVFSTLIAPRRPQDFLNFGAEKSTSALDRRHRFTYTALYETPWFKTSGSWLAKTVLSGWMIGGTYTYETPMMATVQSGIDSNLNGDNAGDRVVINPAGQDGVGSGVTALKNSAGQTVGYLATNPNARYVVAGAGVYPNGGRETLALRPIDNVDLNVSKFIPLKGERVRMQIRADFYNALNHAQFTPGSINTANLTSRTDTRNYLIPSNPAFNNPETAFGSNPRVIQLVGRIEW